ncbi:S1 family peptidase [Pseudomonas sp. B21-015]|uniref:S1 family peptidase n=1 Tax=Pseudomonas sp. B21-015 TaxID=2895473 RepID=UPI00215ED43A|nr:S1 family peptidase [Pseudomonas sp. B21-015]UVM47711.1 S1 family peptidase [Pseudomonas sp. B21-015]
MNTFSSRYSACKERPSAKLEILFQRWLLGLLLLLMCGNTLADLSKTETPQEFVMWLGANDAHGEIINGVAPADPSKWKSIFLSKKNGSWCTAFAVGPRTVMTAAHCVPKDQQITLKRPSKVDLIAQCKIAPSYPTDPTADYALCSLGEDISAGPYETLNRKYDKLIPGTRVLLTGYGCRQFVNQSEQDFSTGIVTYYSKAEGNYGVLGGGASVCFGDSGGPAFVVSNDDVANRVLIGLNSQLWSDGMTSLLSLIPTDVESFFQDLNTKGWIICGITLTARKCRHE